MSDYVDIKVDARNVGVALRRYSSRSKNLPMDAFAQLMLGEIDDLFQSQGASGTDGAWAPFSEATLKRHPRRAGGSLLQATGATANIQVRSVGPDTVDLVSPTEWAPAHIEGTRNMPKRDFFAVNYSHVLDEIGDLALQEIQS